MKIGHFSSKSGIIPPYRDTWIPTKHKAEAKKELFLEALENQEKLISGALWDRSSIFKLCSDLSVTQN